MCAAVVQAHGISCADNVVKECKEEASIPIALSEKTRAVGAITYYAIHPDGLIRGVLFCYDLQLPEDFIPEPEVQEVSCLLARACIQSSWHAQTVTILHSASLTSIHISSLELAPDKHCMYAMLILLYIDIDDLDLNSP